MLPTDLSDGRRHVFSVTATPRDFPWQAAREPIRSTASGNPLASSTSRRPFGSSGRSRMPGYPSTPGGRRTPRSPLAFEVLPRRMACGQSTDGILLNTGHEQPSNACGAALSRRAEPQRFPWPATISSRQSPTAGVAFLAPPSIIASRAATSGETSGVPRVIPILRFLWTNDTCARRQMTSAGGVQPAVAPKLNGGGTRCVRERA